jgi:hypothetical protein
MTNEQYLIVSYFIVAIVCVALAVLVYFLLRRSFMGVSEALRERHLNTALRRLFPLGLLLPTLLGFVSVSYRSCDRNTYEKIVQSRSHLVAKNQEQIVTALLAILIAVLLWNLVIVFVLKYARNERVKDAADNT